MAKKVVASLQKKDGRTTTKCIRMDKSPKTGAYTFREEMIPNALIKDFMDGKEIV